MIIFKFLREYLRRTLRNYKIYTISILDMSVAIIVSFFIHTFTFKELTVDHFLPHCLEYMSYWLENFAYWTSMGSWFFAVAGFSTLLIELLMVSWQSYRAAVENPIEALGSE